VRTQAGNDYLPLTALCELLEIKYETDILLQSFKLGEGARQALFLAEQRYYFQGESVIHLSAPPRFSEGDFYLPAAVAAIELGRLSGKTVSYQPESRELRICDNNGSLPTINTGNSNGNTSLIRRIIIDAGHGGKDPGAVGNGLNEKDIALALALQTAQALNRADPSFEIILTRDRDVFIPLSDRAKIANQAHGDIFISIHCNASRRRAANGFEIFVLNADASDNSARTTAELENSAIEYESAEAQEEYSNDVDGVLARLRLNEYQQESVALAGEVKAQIISRYRMEDRGVKSARFYVLRGALMPSVLVETAFISNPEDARKLRDPEFQSGIAAAITQGVIAFKEQFEAACAN